MSTVRVMSYNVRHAVLDDGIDAWPRRRGAVLELLRSCDPHVLGLQESTGDQHDDVVAALPGYEWIGAAAEPGSGEHNPVGVADRFELLEAGTEWLSETPDVPESVGWDAAYARVLTRATLADAETGRELTVFNTHFDHRGSTARLESARQLRRRVDALPAHREAVVLGDFNARAETAPYEVIVGDGFERSLVDARRTADGTDDPGTTVTDFESFDRGRRLDHVFLTRGLDTRRYAVRTDRTEDGRFPSDHLPVCVTLALE